ncbi:polyketide synthase [Amylocarpus encephaloides]|uniref:Polyketide synthase n=1 Tax=Amylocarpus encephaloides TaxID=45428 RepID=A0A9P7YK80_9HELO|nr:polyketide synthase [Amylocarpus encephaloides]
MREPSRMTEPIAVIGLDAKLPCDGDTPESFYEFLVAGRSARGPVPPERYNSEAFWHPDSHRDGIIGGREGHFIKSNVKAFDAPFFSITPAEAASMDPQQRMLLECVYTALENSGLSMDAVQGSLTGVYVGAFIWDYRDVMIKDVDAPMMYTGSGTIASTLAGRVNWFYDFRGPAFCLDTACSSSMVALHQAIIGLKSGDCDMALACGTNLILSPEMGLELNALGVLNQDGVSFSFDERANGYGRSEGIGAVVLKRMSDAIRDGDTIRAVIRNTGCNHDGHSPGLTAPARESQSELMRKTYAQVGLDPSETRFFEAHGTGTPVGDPIEASAISEMFTPHRSPEEPLIIGAVKSNIGHSEGASGIASVIKGILTLERGIIPANTWFENRNSKIPDDWHFHFPTTALPWPQTKTGLRRMSINSFGVSGTNAHVVMEDAFHFLKEHGYVAPNRTIDVPQLQKQAITNGNHVSAPSQLFVLSSHDQDGISRLCKAYKEYLPTMTDPLHNLSFTMAAKRTQFNWRAAIVANSAESLQEALGQKQQVTRVAADTGLAFVFTGQGAQWARMGMELIHYPVFRQSLEEADAYLETLECSWSVIDELSKASDESRLNEAELSQPLCTILQVALVDLLAVWGVSGRAVAGHSSGEIAAAYAVGAISRESAWKIAYWRGESISCVSTVLMDALAWAKSLNHIIGNMSAKLARSDSQPQTTMAAVGLDFEKATDAIERVNKSGFEDISKLAIACMNSKTSHTISGDAAQIGALVKMLNADKIFARKLTVEMAYHSRYMEPMSDEYARCMGVIEPGIWTSDNPQPQFFSSTYGTLIDVSKLKEAAYWTKNLVSPVRFHESMSAMFRAMSEISGEKGQTPLITDMLEIGPHAALKGPLRNIVDEVRGTGAVRYHNMLRRGEPDLQSALDAAGSLFSRGIQIDLVQVNHVDGVEPSMLINLPRYPFNHSKEYWYESRLSRNFRNRAYIRHELLGAPVNDWDGKHDAIWRNWIRLSENPWVEHHTISGAILYPAAGMLVMAIEGCRQLAESSNSGKSIKGFRFREVSFHAALQIPDGNMGIESHLYLRPVKQAALESKASPWREFQICTAQDDDEWREHCRGQVLVEYNEANTLVDGGLEEELLQTMSNNSIEEAQKTCTTEVVAKKIYEAWSDVGLVFGPTFQTVSDPFVDHKSGKAFAKVNSTMDILKKLMPHEYVQSHLIHPTTLDGALQVCLAPLISNPVRKQTNAIVLTFLDELWVSGSQHSDDGYLVCADTEPHGRKEYEMACTAVDSSTKQPMVLVKGLIVTEVDASTSSASSMLSTLGERYVQYDFTHTSSTSFNEARQRLPDDRVRFQVLDMEKLPATQGFEAGTYDTLLATASLNIAANIDGMLSNALSLLKPQGKLILTVTEGIDATATWGTHLLNSGFAGLETLFLDEGRSVVVSSAPPGDKETSSTPTGSSYYIVIDAASDLQQRVGNKLCSSLAARGEVATYGTISQYTQLTATWSQESVSNSTCILLPELAGGLLTSVTEDVLAGLKGMANGKSLLWVNKDGCPDTDLVTGFATCIRLEKPELDFTILTFQPEETVEVIISKILEVDTAVARKEGPTETSYKVIDGLVCIPRLVEASSVTKHIKKQTLAAEVADAAFGADPSRSLRLQIQDIGLLDSLCFDDDPLQPLPLADTDVEFKTMATAVNFKDLAVMLGKIKETPVGLEAAGIVTRVGSGVTGFKPGERVFGFAFKGAFSTHVRALEGTIAHIPEKLTFAEAACIPIVYTTAYACLYDIGDLGKRSSRGIKSTVLIHAAAGGVGQAAIQLAQREGAEIFATVGSLEKRDFLEKTYGLPRDHILSSRDTTFKAGVMRMTNGRGVDIVINSLAGDILRATWECVAPFGRFAEIGLTDIESRARISMGIFARSARFEAIELNYMQKTDMGRIEDLFKRAMGSVLGQGLKRSTPIRTYSISQVQDALRYMQSGKHIGKLVVESHDNDVVPVVQPPKTAAKFSSDASYVVSGGFGGLGIEIIRWMVHQGARNLIVTSRRGAAGEAAETLVAELQNKGVNIATPACDITDGKALDGVISSCLSHMPPVRGCIQASTILSDNTFSNMTLDQWESTLSVKVSGTWNLWETLSSKNADSTLDFFVMFSSMASIIGNPGQTNYAAGNSYQDALARHLSSQGHNAVALNVPMMSDAGMVATKPQLMQYLFSIGWSHMSAEELIAGLDFYCRPLSENKDMTADQAQVVPRLWLPQYSAAEGAVQPTWQHEPRFNHMVLHGFNSGDTSAKQGSGKGSTAAHLSAAKSTQEAEKVVLDALLEKLTKVLSVDMAELDPSRPMHAYGVDSLVAVELRTWMAKEIGSDVSVFEMTSGQRIGQLAAKAAGTSRFVQV